MEHPIKKVYYFNGYGRAEALRMMLCHACCKYEDCRIEFSDWPNHKASMAGGCMPNVEFADGKKLGCTNAIMRMVGAKCGYYPEDAMLAYCNDFLTDLYMDYFDKLIAFLRCSEEEKKAKC